MPSWCDNTLAVSGDIQTRQAFIRLVREGPFLLDFGKLIPQPNMSPAAAEGWRILHWGTKSNASDVRLEVGVGSAVAPGVVDTSVYEFKTQWTPISNELLIRMAELFPTLMFSLYFITSDTNMEGNALAERGVLVSSEHHVVADAGDDGDDDTCHECGYNYDDCSCTDGSDVEHGGPELKSDDPLEN